MEKHRLKRSSLKLFKLVGINLVLLFVLLELVSLVFYFFQTRSFFYPANKDRIKASATQFKVTEPDRESWMSDYQIHPYLGFINPPNYFEFPLRKTSQNQFFIGIFGGSVAQRFCDYEAEHHALVKMLQPLPEFHNKEIVILKFANQAHKQPQQLLALNYFLAVGQELDLVINIDGFNELALSYLNNKVGTEVSMPTDYIFSPLVGLANKDFSTGHLELALEVLQLRDRVQNAHNSLSDCRLATCYMLRWVQAKYLLNQYREKQQTFIRMRAEAAKSSLIYLKRTEVPLDDSEALERIVDLWFHSSLAMSDLLAARKIPYLEFIQPNQYYSPNRQFSVDEKKIAFDEQSQYKEATVKGYPKLLAKLSSLRAAGVTVFNGVSAFDGTSETVYGDNCCHYNDAGNHILSRYIGQSIETVFNKGAAPK